MCNIVLNDDLSIRSYFEKVLELVKSGEDFPVNLDEVWPLIYSDKGKAVRVLTGDNGFIKDIDYKVFTQNGKNPTGGRPTLIRTPYPRRRSNPYMVHYGRSLILQAAPHHSCISRLLVSSCLFY